MQDFSWSLTWSHDHPNNLILPEFFNFYNIGAIAFWFRHLIQVTLKLIKYYFSITLVLVLIYCCNLVSNNSQRF